MNRILTTLMNRIKNYSRFMIFWKPDFCWLNKNRFLRMDANEPLYDKKRREFHLDRYRFAVDCLKKTGMHGLDILDAACGTGYGSDVLKGLDPGRIVGIDISSEAVAYANKKYGGPNCVFKVSDITDMSRFTDATFDAAVSFETVEHIKDPLAFLKELKRVLKNDGTLIISTPNKWGPTKDHEFDYSYGLLRDHLEQFFQIEDIYVQNSGSLDLWINRNMPRRLVRADEGNIEEAECFIAVCKKPLEDSLK